MAELNGTVAGTLMLCSHLDTVLRENFAVRPAFHRLGIGELRVDLADELARVASVPALHQGRRDRERRRLTRARLPGASLGIQRRSPAPCPQKCCHHLLRLVSTEPPSDSQLVAILRPVPEPNSSPILEPGSRSAPRQPCQRRRETGPQVQRPTRPGVRCRYWPTRPSIRSRSRSAWPLWRAYSSIM